MKSQCHQAPPFKRSQHQPWHLTLGTSQCACIPPFSLASHNSSFDVPDDQIDWNNAMSFNGCRGWVSFDHQLRSLAESSPSIPPTTDSGSAGKQDQVFDAPTVLCANRGTYLQRSAPSSLMQLSPHVTSHETNIQVFDNRSKSSI